MSVALPSIVLATTFMIPFDQCLLLSVSWNHIHLCVSITLRIELPVRKNRKYPLYFPISNGVSKSHPYMILKILVVACTSDLGVLYEHDISALES